MNSNLRFFLRPTADEDRDKYAPQEIEILTWNTADGHSGAIFAVIGSPNPNQPGDLPRGTVSYTRIGRIIALVLPR